MGDELRQRDEVYRNRNAVVVGGLAEDGLFYLARVGSHIGFLEALLRDTYFGAHGGRLNLFGVTIDISRRLTVHWCRFS